MAAIMLLLLSPYPWLVSLEHTGTSDFHSTLEITGSLLGLIAGMALISRFYVLGNRLHLFIGLAFFINGAEDFMHGLLAFLAEYSGTSMLASELVRFVPATYVTGRLLMGLLLLIAPFASGWLGKSENSKRETIWISLSVLLFAMAATAMAFQIHLPQFIYPEQLISRPVDFISAFALAAALAVFVREYFKSQDILIWWVALSIGVNVVGQLMMSFSTELFDPFFDIAHVYKVLGYAVPLLGFSLFQIALQRELRQAVSALQQTRGELEERVEKRTAELAAANKKSQAREAFMHALVSRVADGIISINETGTVRSFNPAAENTFGYKADEVIGQNIKILMPEPFRSEHDGYLKRYYETGEAVILGNPRELTGLRKNGSTFPLELTVTETAGEDGRIFIGSLHDISERKKADETIRQMMAVLKRSNEELQKFAYVASHDLQEPLRMVTSYLQLIERRYKGQLDSDAEEFIGFAVDGAKRMKGLILDLLSYSRVGTRGTAFLPTDMEQILTIVLSNLETSIAEAHAQISHDKLPTILADSGQMSQLLQNLIGNALHYRSPERPPEIHLSASRAEKMSAPAQQPLQPGWVFRISDNGIGIEPEFFERIFVIFQRLHPKSESDGSGIGLAVCKKIVERHGGWISVESEPGKGSSFIFYLPDKPPEPKDEVDSVPHE